MSNNTNVAKTSTSWMSQVISTIPFWKVVSVLLAIEVLSYSAFHLAGFQLPFFLAIVLITAGVSLWKLEYGVYIMLTELFIGSKGYLFEVAVGGFPVSIRLALFLIVFAAACVHMLRTKEIGFFVFRYWKESVALVAVLAMGVIVGVLNGNAMSNVFFDANGYLFFGMIVPVTQAIRSQKQWNILFALGIAAVVAVTIKTLVVLGLFSQLEILPFTLPGIYKWVRDTGIGEITRFPTGFSRIFFQGHIYMLLLLFTVLPLFTQKGMNAKQWGKQPLRPLAALLVACATVVFISYSRSFWAAVIGAMLVLPVMMWLVYRGSIKETLADYTRAAASLLAAGVIGYLLAFAIVNIPLPGNLGVGAGALVSERTKDLSSEPAAASRWELLDALAPRTLDNPIFGSGLGTTVTYTSSDPRVLEESPDGSYTTFAFEWGYLDFLLKFGLLGCAVMLWVAVRVFKDWWELLRNRYESLTPEHAQLLFGLALSIITIAGVHMFTPYLNHPLGIGWLIIILVFTALQFKNMNEDEKV